MLTHHDDTHSQNLREKKDLPLFTTETLARAVLSSFGEEMASTFLRHGAEDEKSSGDVFPESYQYSYGGGSDVPYSYVTGGQPFVSLYSSGETCKLSDIYDRKLVIESECVQSTFQNYYSSVQFSYEVQCESSSAFSPWTAIIYSNDNCNSGAVARLVGNGPCACETVNFNGDDISMKVNCGGIFFFPCTSYFDDASYYGTEATVPVYASVFSEDSCSAKPATIEATIGQTNKTMSSNVGLTFQNGRCIEGIFGNNMTLGFRVDCVEPTTSAKWTVGIYSNCSSDVLARPALSTSTGSSPCECASGVVNGITYAMQLNCAGSSSYTCEATSIQSLYSAEKVAGVVIGAFAAMAILVSVGYLLAAILYRRHIPSKKRSGARDEDESSFRDTEITVIHNPVNPSQHAGLSISGLSASMLQLDDELEDRQIDPDDS